MGYLQKKQTKSSNYEKLIIMIWDNHRYLLYLKRTLFMELNPRSI